MSYYFFKLHAWGANNHGTCILRIVRVSFFHHKNCTCVSFFVYLCTTPCHLTMQHEFVNRSALCAPLMLPLICVLGAPPPKPKTPVDEDTEEELDERESTLQASVWISYRYAWCFGDRISCALVFRCHQFVITMYMYYHKIFYIMLKLSSHVNFTTKI